jgi:hypothetical protein
MRIILGCMLLGACLTASAQSTHIQPESTPPAKDGALTIQDIPPIFARPFVTPPSPKDEQVASSEKELFKEEIQEPVRKETSTEDNIAKEAAKGLSIPEKSDEIEKLKPENTQETKVDANKMVAPE